MTNFEYQPETVYIDHLRPRITFLDDGGRRVEFERTKEQGQEAFGLICGIAIAQDLASSAAEGTRWPGADDQFLLTLLKHLEWNISIRALRTYWVDFRHGQACRAKRACIMRGGGYLPEEEQRGLAAPLFQAQTELWLGKRTRKGPLYRYWPIKFISDPDETLCRFVQEYLATQTSYLPTPVGSSPVTAGGASSRHNTAPDSPRGFASAAGSGRTDHHNQELADYLDGLCARYSRLALFSEKHEGLRNQLYIQRSLSPPTTATARSGQASTDSAQDVSQSDRSNTHPQSKILQQLLAGDTSVRISVLGDAGAGKTTLMEDLAANLARREHTAVDHGNARVPFLLTLRYWTPESHSTLEDFACSQAERCDPALVRQLCESGRAVLLLDGVDEVPEKDGRRRAFLEWIDGQVTHPALRRCAVVLAGRPWAFDWALLRRFRAESLRLEELTPEDIGRYVTNYYECIHEPKRGRGLLQQMKKVATIRVLAKRPLLLMLLCYVCEEGVATLPSTEGELLEEALRRLLRLRDLPEEASLRVLGQMAWTCWTTKQGHLTARKAVESTVEALQTDDVVRTTWCHSAPEQILNDLLHRSGVLLKHREAYYFAEETYVEYLAGRRLGDEKQPQH